MAVHIDMRLRQPNLKLLHGMLNLERARHYFAVGRDTHEKPSFANQASPMPSVQEKRASNRHPPPT
jgi:hypothetical protein